MLQTRQAIQVADAINPSAEQLAEAKQRLRAVLNATLKWRELQEWDPNQSPYPGLLAFEAHQAPVFFGRDAAIKTVVQRLTSLALSAPGFLLLLGASGYGKSSLVRAGVVPWLRAERQRRWLVLEPFKPGLDPFGALRGGDWRAQRLGVPTTKCASFFPRRSESPHQIRHVFPGGPNRGVLLRGRLDALLTVDGPLVRDP